MTSALNRFVNGLVGADGEGRRSVESIQRVDEDTVGIVFDTPETFRPDLNTAAEDAGVSLSNIERTGNERTAAMARDQGTFFDEPMTADRSKKRVTPTEIQREPSGEFTYPLEDTTSAPNSPARRGPDGEFVSNDLEDAGIGRRERNGLFDLLR
jgi:hypothetical protein